MKKIITRNQAPRSKLRGMNCALQAAGFASQRPKGRRIELEEIKGGLGNQLFCYAAVRRLALINNAELVIDDTTGFARDRQYHRNFALDHFQIPVRKATPAERLEPFERFRRGILK